MRNQAMRNQGLISRIFSIVTVTICVAFASISQGKKTMKTDKTNWCKPTVIKVSPQSTIPNIKEKLDHMDRIEIVQSVWGEMTKTPAPGPLAIPMLHYLASTAQVSKIRGYYLTMGTLLTGQQDLQPLVDAWPNIPKLQDPHLSLKEMCRLYDKVGGPQE